MLVDHLDAVLPQTQCTRCGYEGCRPYAEAIARQEAEINRCAPGGEPTIIALAALAGRAVRSLDPACGEHAPIALAQIDELRCIGCTLCIEVCPVDAILGAAKRMHAVVATLCSGCELCLAPCPVDCITMVPAEHPWAPADADAARSRHRSRLQRLARGERIEQRGATAGHDDAGLLRHAAVDAALARARARRGAATREPR